MMSHVPHAAAVATALVAVAMQADISAAADAERASDGGQAPGTIVIDAAQGIEWFRKTRVVIA
jgi:hypothetical protein